MGPQKPSGVAESADETLNSLSSPSSRHYAEKVTQKSFTKDLNTVVDRSVVDLTADVAAIRAGKAQRVGNTFTVNNRVYGVHDGTLYPISGPGFYTLDRGAYKALGVYNKFGDTSQANIILNNMGISEQARVSAIQVWSAVKK